MPSKSDTQANEQMLEIDGKFYPISELPKEVTDMLGLFTRWTNEKTEAIIELQKIDAALKSLGTEITARVAVYDAQKARLQAAND